MRIELEDGKYTLLWDEDSPGLRALRYGEPWRDLTGDKFVLLLGLRIEELEAEVERLSDLLGNSDET